MTTRHTHTNPNSPQNVHARQNTRNQPRNQPQAQHPAFKSYMEKSKIIASDVLQGYHASVSVAGKAAAASAFTLTGADFAKHWLYNEPTQNASIPAQDAKQSNQSTILPPISKSSKALMDAFNQPPQKNNQAVQTTPNQTTQLTTAQPQNPFVKTWNDGKEVLKPVLSFATEVPIFVGLVVGAALYAFGKAVSKNRVYEATDTANKLATKQNDLDLENAKLRSYSPKAIKLTTPQLNKFRSAASRKKALKAARQGKKKEIDTYNKKVNKRMQAISTELLELEKHRVRMLFGPIVSNSKFLTGLFGNVLSRVSASIRSAKGGLRWGGFGWPVSIAASGGVIYSLGYWIVSDMDFLPAIAKAFNGVGKIVGDVANFAVDHALYVVGALFATTVAKAVRDKIYSVVSNTRAPAQEDGGHGGHD